MSDWGTFPEWGEGIGSAGTVMRANAMLAGLDAEATRLRGAGIRLDDPWPVEGFATLRYAETRDPEGVPVGLLDGE